MSRANAVAVPRGPTGALDRDASGRGAPERGPPERGPPAAPADGPVRAAQGGAAVTAASSPYRFGALDPAWAPYLSGSSGIAVRALNPLARPACLVLWRASS